VLYLLLLRPWALNADPRWFVGRCWSQRSGAAVMAVVAGLRPRWSAFALCWLILCWRRATLAVLRLDIASERQRPPRCRLRARGSPGAAQAPRQAVLLGCVLALGALTWQRNRLIQRDGIWSDVVMKGLAQARRTTSATRWSTKAAVIRARHHAYDRAIALDPADYTPRFNRLALGGCPRLQHRGLSKSRIRETRIRQCRLQNLQRGNLVGRRLRSRRTRRRRIRRRWRIGLREAIALICTPRSGPLGRQRLGEL
jgi:hypothetical protein